MGFSPESYTFMTTCRRHKKKNLQTRDYKRYTEYIDYKLKKFAFALGWIFLSLYFFGFLVIMK